jgi:ubiquinone biosynthesis protein
LRLALGELGVTFTKLGQMLSTRADLLPAALTAELSQLQDAAPPVAFADIERTLREDLGSLPEWPFASLESTPIASASIGQVHAGTLLDGSSVVVKVRRPNVVEQVEVDLEIMHNIVDWVRAHTDFAEDYDLEALVDEFGFTLRDELDYVHEANNATRLRRAFEGDPGVWIPRVYDSISTARVLVLERVGGVKVSDLAALDRLGISRRALAENAVRIFLRQLLEFGFFHADPHPGNFFVQPDATLAIVDFGMVGRISDATRQRLLRTGLAAMNQDAEELAESLYALGVAGKHARRAAFQKDLDHVIGRYGGQSIRELSATAVVNELMRIALRHKLQLPSELALLMRVVTMSEGLGLTLDPEFRYLEYASPILRRTWQRLHSPLAIAKSAGRAATDSLELGMELPRRTGHLLARFERGDVQIAVNHRGLERVTQEFHRMTNRLALSVILGASVVALGMAVGIRHVPALEPVIAWIFKLGLLFSLLFGASVLWGIWRAGRRP